tara:strand:+ start:4038 stop:4529 length:492 start_codon:yes stop_codon:yes gene_type:complete
MEKIKGVNMNVYQWLDAYAETHQNPLNKKIHWICVPLIMISLFGILSQIKISFINDEIPIFLYLLIVASILFYFSLSFSLTIGMIFVSSMFLYIVTSINSMFNNSLNQLLIIYLAIFFISWIGQFVGHKIEGKKPSFFDDIKFLLIGPAWLLSFIYNKSGIKY